jgi:hypothetical protein
MTSDGTCGQGRKVSLVAPMLESSWAHISMPYLIVQLGVVTEHLNRKWFERNTGRAVNDVRKRIPAPGDPVDEGHSGRNGRGGPPLFFTSGGSVCAIEGPDQGRRPRTQSRIAQGPFGLPSRPPRKPDASVFQSRPLWKDRGPHHAPVQIASNPKARGQLYTGPESFSTIFVDSSASTRYQHFLLISAAWSWR